MGNRANAAAKGDFSEDDLVSLHRTIGANDTSRGVKDGAQGRLYDTGELSKPDATTKVSLKSSGAQKQPEPSPEPAPAKSEVKPKADPKSETKAEKTPETKAERREIGNPSI